MACLYNLFFRPSSISVEIAEKAKILYNNAYPTPYQSNQIGIVESEGSNNSFFQLDKNLNGEEYLDALRKILSFQGENWTHLCFYLRPAIYHVITWQKLPWIVSLLQSPEGSGWLNRSYPLLTLRTQGESFAPEYPIHTAVRVACQFKWTQRSRHQSEQIVRKLLELQANVNQADSLGRTPLHIALMANQCFLIQLLIEHGAVALNVECQRDPLSDRQFCTLFKERQIVIQKAQKILLDAIQLPSVITNIALDYLF